MSTPSRANSPESVKGLRHDLGTVLGNLRAFEFLFFSQANAGARADYKETYSDLMKRLDGIVARMASLEKPSSATQPGGAEGKE